MATGMDINQMVDDLMRAERQPLDKMVQDRQWLEWQREDYRDMNLKVETFRRNLLEGVMMGSNMNSKTVTSSNSNHVTASASASSMNGTHTISDVTQLATAATTFSSGSISDHEIDPDESLFSQKEHLQNFDKGENEKLEFDIKTHTSEGLITREFEFSTDDSLKDILGEINSSDVGINAYYDPHTDRVSMTRTETGKYNIEGNEIEFGENSDFLLDTLKLEQKHFNENGDVVVEEGEDTTSNVIDGQNAKFTYNGLQTERESNIFTIEGVSFTLNQTFDGPTTLNVSANTDHVFDHVVEFVEEYNELIATVNEKTQEDRHRDYRPLTDEQKDAMTETEIERWEEMARSGTLRSDRILSSGMGQLRMDAYSPLDNDDTSFRLLSDIGVNLVSDYNARGMLEIDEEELRHAIETDSDGVYQMFAADGDSFEEKGVARRMRESLGNTMDSITDRTGGAKVTIDRNIGNINDRISNFERRLQQTEQRYWNQFNAMERAVQQSNAQADQMFSLMGGGGMPM